MLDMVGRGLKVVIRDLYFFFFCIYVNLVLFLKRFLICGGKMIWNKEGGEFFFFLVFMFVLVIGKFKVMACFCGYRDEVMSCFVNLYC